MRSSPHQKYQYQQTRKYHLSIIIKQHPFEQFGIYVYLSLFLLFLSSERLD
jgi:hypothetical protein